MKNLIAFPLLACMAISAPPVQGNASPVTEHVAVSDTATENNAIAQSSSFVLHARDIEFATLNALGTPLAIGCCDQSYQVQRTMSSTSCCDQSYSPSSMLPPTKALLAIVGTALLLLALNHHFSNTTARWILEH